MANDKYSKNRNLWRKTYGFRRRKPDVRTLVDPDTQVTYSLDVNKVIRDRDFFIIRGRNISQSLNLGSLQVAEYDEGLVWFNGTTTYSEPFNFTFSGTPYVVLTPEDGNDVVINPHGISITTTTVDFGVSAPFSGAVRYRAVYSPNGYPAVATSSFSSSFTCSAGSATLTQESLYTAVYANLGFGAPTEFRQTAWDVNSLNDTDIYLEEVGSRGLAANANILSAPLSNEIHFIAVF